MRQRLGIILKTVGSEVRLPGANRGSTTSLCSNRRQVSYPISASVSSSEKRGNNGSTSKKKIIIMALPLKPAQRIR